MAFVPRLHIHNLGPIEDCDLPMNRMMVLNGPQAAGKSTIAKAIFYFRTVKDEIAEYLFRSGFDKATWLNVSMHLLEKLDRIFGDSISIGKGASLSYEYTPKISIEINLVNDAATMITGSPPIMNALDEYHEMGAKAHIYSIRSHLQELFADKSQIVYLPAGRSFTSLLTHQLNYIFAIMDDKQKNMLDYCMKNYMERVMKIKPQLFEQQLSSEIAKADTAHFEFMSFVRKYMWRILKGRYVNRNGVEGIELSNSDSGKLIPLNFASSGQQEALWILNIIYYYLREKQPMMFIIEEPEAHLYPDSQKNIAEYIALALHEKNECVVTTHSPYILGALNNLLDIKRLSNKGIDVSRLLENKGFIHSQLLKREEFDAYFVNGGKLENAMDEETGLIRNEMIDGASDEINRLADEIFALEYANNE